MFLKHEFKVGFFRWVGPIFLGLLWDIKIFFEIQRFWQQNCREWRRKNYFLFLAIEFYDFSYLLWFEEKSERFFLIWLIKCPYFFVVIADDKFEMIVGRTFLIFFLVHFFTSFFIRKFSTGFICKKTIEFTYYITY